MRPILILLGMTLFSTLLSVPDVVWAEEDSPPQSILDDPDYDPSIPWYQSLKSGWGLHLRTAIRNFPSPGASGNLFQLSGEWILPFQKAGLFSIGGTLGGVMDLQSGFGIYSLFPMVGGVLRYQLKVFKNQPLVPTFAVSYDYYRIPNGADLIQTPDGNQAGFSYGIMLNLSWLDQVTARDAYRSLGMTKAYLTAEIFNTEFQNAVFSLIPEFYVFGLRLEFE
ncbi:MAG: hypothetical protein KGP28_04715 [Bdellovibrionales bacterium]|nr:hypothetical protein [Bdellovibrionales bacterium]